MRRYICKEHFYLKANIFARAQFRSDPQIYNVDLSIRHKIHKYSYPKILIFDFGPQMKQIH